MDTAVDYVYSAKALPVGAEKPKEAKSSEILRNLGSRGTSKSMDTDVNSVCSAEAMDPGGTQTAASGFGGLRLSDW